MAIEIRPSDGEETVIRFTGNLNMDAWGEFREKVLSLEPRRTYVLDIRELEELDTAGIGMLMKFRQDIGGGHSDITLLGCNSSFTELLACLECHRWFNVPNSCIYYQTDDGCNGQCMSAGPAFDPLS
jgi:anti-anti-sigma regulatory factor